MLRGLNVKFNTFLINHTYAGTKRFAAKRRCMKRLGHIVGENTKIVGPVFCTGKLVIGDNCWIGKNFTVNGNGTVAIGNNCDIGPEVSFETGGHEIGSRERRAGSGRTYRQTVGDGCWLGAHTVVFNETQIGQGSVIAGCSCVVHSIPDNVLAGGVPAKIIRELL